MATEIWQLSPWGEKSIFHPDYDLKKQVKSLSVQFVSSQHDFLQFNVRLAVTAFQLEDNNAVVYVNFLGQSIGITSIKIKKSGTHYINLPLQLAPDYLNDLTMNGAFKAFVICDGLTAESSNFKITSSNQDQHKMASGNSCGLPYQGKTVCTQYHGSYGPYYHGRMPFEKYSGFDSLIQAGTITSDEKDIIIAMSENEGNLDSVQSFDDQIVSVGAMQKTINPDGYGELPIQIWEFKLKFPIQYSLLLEKCKWEIKEIQDDENKPAKYQAFYNNITGEALKREIRKGFSKANFGKRIDSYPILPLIALANDKDFQGKQVEDFVSRLHESLSKRPTGSTYNIHDYIHSKLGKALVLDHSINRPGHVSPYFGEALKRLFKSNPGISKNPLEWAGNHGAYEKELLALYGPLRGNILGKWTKPMTNATKRYNHLKNKLG